MEGLLGPASGPWGQLGNYIESTQYDDVVALASVLCGTVAYLTKGKLWARPDPTRQIFFESPQKQSNSVQSKRQSRDLAERLQQHGADIAVLWASQSGVAERLATRLSQDLTRRFETDALLLDVSDIDPATCKNVPSSKLVVFLASTYGEGDPSDNMNEFWAYLHQEEASSLSNLRFVAFGLGNSHYKYFNHVIDVLIDSMQKRGAKLLLPVGKGDDAKGETEEHFLEWKEQLFEAITSIVPVQRRQRLAYTPSLRVAEDKSIPTASLTYGVREKRASAKATSTQSNIYHVPVSQSRELFASTADRNCVHMEFDIAKYPELKYKTGDHLAVWPITPTAEVDRLLRLLGLDQSRATPYRIESTDESPTGLPTPTTLENLFANCLEICAPLSREHLCTLAAYAPSKEASDFLLKISSSRQAYAAYQSTRYVNLPRALEAACSDAQAWKSVPLSLIVEILPEMRPRYYSIASSAMVDPRRVAIAAVVSNQKLSTEGETIPGLASNYLLSVMNGSAPRRLTSTAPSVSDVDEMPVSIRRSNFYLPIASSTPIVMVAAGTGLAPFRAFVQERTRLKFMGRDVGQMKLVLGCRNAEEDYIYQDELTGWAEQLGSTLTVTTAFSRPGPEQRGRYVQHCIAGEADYFSNMLVDDQAYFYICGSASMARGVVAAVEQAVMQSRRWTEIEFKTFADRQKRLKRWKQDVWG